jgi:hypothetical protein
MWNGRSGDNANAQANGREWPNPELFAAGHARPESQINEPPFDTFL